MRMHVSYEIAKTRLRERKIRIRPFEARNGGLVVRSQRFRDLAIW